MPDNIKNIQNELSKVIVGKKEITDKILMAILARGHVLLEDVPGVGKTTTALGLSKILGLDFRRIQFTPDVVPSDVTGFTMYDKETGEFRYRPGAVMCNMVLADEIYEKLVYDANAPHISIASLNPEIADLTITCNGFSKTYSMTGWRLGYLTAPLWLAKRIIAFQSHSTSNPTTFVQWAGITALKEASADVERMRKAFAERRDLIYNLISEIDGVKCIRPQGAFYLFCDISSFGLKSDEFCERLLAEEMLAVIPGKGFGADGCIRLSYACSESMIREAARRLAKFCAALCK